MSNLLISLAGGLLAVALLNLLLWRYTGLDARRSAGVAGLATLGVYVPVAVLAWPGGDVFAIHLALYLLVSVAFGIFGGARERRQGKGRRLHWGPLTLVSFFLGLLVVDTALVMVAESGLSMRLASLLLPEPRSGAAVYSAFPGVVSHDFQKKESLYNAYLEQRQRQEALGWEVRKGWLETPVRGRPALFRVAVADRDGRPLQGAAARGRFLRPADSRLDRDIELAEVAPGVYETAVTLPAAGSWNLVLSLSRGDGLYEIRASTSVADP